MSTTTREIDDYVAAVHAALADLPDAEREDLLDDLPQHLADVQADAQGGALAELIGTPEAYAAELRATAGLGTSPAHPWWPKIRQRLVEADERVGAALRYDRFVDLCRALAPAWWLVRAYLVVQVCTHAVSRFGSHALVPQVGGNRVAGVVFLVAACAASVWLGRRGFTHVWQRVLSVLLGLALFWYGLVLVGQIDETATVYRGSDGGYDGPDVSGVRNVYPVGPDGTVLKGIRLYDQDGNPIVLGIDCPATDDGTGQTYEVDGIPSATSAPTYPQTCPTDQGPFPSGTAPALPAASSTTPAPAASSTPAPRVPATPTPTG